MPHGSLSRPPPLHLAVALVLAALTAACGDAAPAGGDTTEGGSPGPRSGERLVVDLGCAACHDGVPGPARPEAPPLGARAADPAWTFAYLDEPARYARQDAGEGAGSRMPDFPLDEAERVALALFVAEAAPRAGEEAAGARAREDPAARRAFRDARAAHPDLGPEDGRRLVAALNCAGCHRDLGPQPRRNGPDLSRQGSRARPGWLAGWLRAPTAIRPYGDPPGSGGRMPDFRLTRAESDSLAAFLLRSPTTGPGGPEGTGGAEEADGAGGADGAGPDERGEPPARAAGTLTPFQRRKADALLRDRHACLGCHALAGDGGRIGPDLARTAARRPGAWIRGMVRDPEATSPGTVMPRILLPPETAELLEAYLLTMEGDDGRAPDAREESLGPRRGYLSPLEHPLLPRAPAEAGPGADAYLRLCAACHGPEGRADGYNVRYLPITPTPHASAEHMSTRTDHTLFDGVHAGGRILGRSHRMPPFGGSLEREEVWDLVARMRSLCRCLGPAWSRDAGEVPERVLEAGAAAGGS